MAKPIWEKSLALDAILHRFTVGDDPILDLHILPFDCLASAAHARMLHHCGHLTEQDLQALLVALQDLHQQASAGEISIDPDMEDAHTALEHALTERCGDAGKRIHLGRSRNDQVLVAMRLFAKHKALQLQMKVAQLSQVLLDLSAQHQQQFLPGYTHLQAAMPSSISLWLQGFASGLLEELDAATGLNARLDRNPLGAAAGFGVPILINRELTSELLGFTQTQWAATDCMNSRGRHEQALLDWCVSTSLGLEKLLWDLSLYCSQEFALLKLPDAFTTGSSIMPQKRNPDVVELARAQCRALRGTAATHLQIISGLPSSYHRDFQLGKAPFFDALARFEALLNVLLQLLPGVEFELEKIKRCNRDELYATQAALQRVQAGQSFRDAYQAIGRAVMDGTLQSASPEARNLSYLFDTDALNQQRLQASTRQHQQAILQLQSQLNRTWNQVWKPS